MQIELCTFFVVYNELTITLFYCKNLCTVYSAVHRLHCWVLEYSNTVVLYISNYN